MDKSERLRKAVSVWRRLVEVEKEMLERTVVRFYWWLEKDERQAGKSWWVRNRQQLLSYGWQEGLEEAQEGRSGKKLTPWE